MELGDMETLPASGRPSPERAGLVWAVWYSALAKARRSHARCPAESPAGRTSKPVQAADVYLFWQHRLQDMADDVQKC